MQTMKKLLIVGGALVIAAAGIQCTSGTGDNQTSSVRLEVTSDTSLGSVVSDVQGIDCGSTCGADYPTGATVTLTATPLPEVDTAFLGWAGACTGTASTCTVTLDQNQTVTASWKMPALPDMAMPPDMATAPAPSVTSVSPASIVNNVASTLTLTGTNLRTGATVTVGGVTCNQVVVVSPTQITCTYPGKAATCGGQGITVTEPDGQNGSLIAAMGLKLRSATLGFAPAASFPIGAGPRMAAVGDFNGDQKLDIAVPNANSNNTSVLLGKTGGLTAATNFTVGSGPQSAAAGDVDGDGKVDLVVSNATTADVSVLRGNGMGGFAAATAFAAGSNPASVILVDVKGV